jgi:hypothetical protein
MLLDVPIPKLYAIFFKKNAGWVYNNEILSTSDDWQRFFELNLPSEFIIKPCCGAYGEGLNAFHKQNSVFIDAFGNTYNSKQLYENLSSNPKHDSFVIQQLLKNHPEITRLSETESLQTIRFITFVDANNNCLILHAHLKPIVGENIIDNFIDGLTGNLEASINLKNGTLNPVSQITSTGFGMKTIHKHPKTGIPFEGFKIPLWNKACNLIKKTTPKFLPIRTIGWDVAITPDKPIIVEANIWWDPQNQHLCMDNIVSILSHQ